MRHESPLIRYTHMNAQRVLQALAPGAPVSGAHLAANLGMSRAAIWKQIETLRAQGLPVAASPGAGYSLPWALELLDVQRIQSELPPALRKRVGSLDVLWSPISTSTELRSRREQAADLSVVVAEAQSAGRGRRGRTWCSPPGLNLYVSLLKRFDGGFASLGGLSLAVGVMMLRAIENAGVVGTGLKWPNDLVAGRAKFGGVLIELDGEMGGPCTAVIGIGINLRAPDAVHKQAQQAVTDLAALCAGVPPPRNRFVAQVIAQLVLGLDDFAANGMSTFADEYAQHDVLRGQTLQVEHAGTSWSGLGAGVDEHGRLCVETESGLRVIDSVETSVRVP